MGHHAGTQRCLDGALGNMKGQSGRDRDLTAEEREKHPTTALRPVRVPEMTKDLGRGRALTCGGCLLSGTPQPDHPRTPGIHLSMVCLCAEWWAHQKAWPLRLSSVSLSSHFRFSPAIPPTNFSFQVCGRVGSPLPEGPGLLGSEQGEGKVLS